MPVVRTRVQLGLVWVGSVMVITSFVSLIRWTTNLGNPRLVKYSSNLSKTKRSQIILTGEIMAEKANKVNIIIRSGVGALV